MLGFNKMAVALLFFGVPSVAFCQDHTMYDQTGIEAGLTYRKGDPFVFCTEGQGWKNAPLQCWTPLPPYTGAFMFSLWCNPPTYGGKIWTNDDIASFAQYQSICPRAMASGTWDGKHGQADQAPIDH